MRKKQRIRAVQFVRSLCYFGRSKIEKRPFFGIKGRQAEPHVVYKRLAFLRYSSFDNQPSLLLESRLLGLRQMHHEAQPLNQADNGANFGATPRQQRNAIVGWFEWLGGSLHTQSRTIFAWCVIVVLIQVLSGALREDAAIRNIPIEIDAEQMNFKTSIPIRLLSKEEKKSCLAAFTKAKTNNHKNFAASKDCIKHCVYTKTRNGQQNASRGRGAYFSLVAPTSRYGSARTNTTFAKRKPLALCCCGAPRPLWMHVRSTSTRHVTRI